MAEDNEVIKFRVDALERDVNELRDLITTQARTDAEFRLALERATLKTNSDMQCLIDKLDVLTTTLKEPLEDWKTMSYGLKFIKGIIGNWKVWVSIAALAVIWGAIPLAKFFK